MGLGLYLVLDTWPPSSCYECSGASGVDWLMVQAPDSAEALDLAVGRLHLEPYDDTHVLAAFRLRDTKGRKTRVLPYSDFTLLPEAEGQRTLKPPAWKEN